MGETLKLLWILQEKGKRRRKEIKNKFVLYILSNFNNLFWKANEQLLIFFFSLYVCLFRSLIYWKQMLLLLSFEKEKRKIFCSCFFSTYKCSYTCRVPWVTCKWYSMSLSLPLFERFLISKSCPHWDLNQTSHKPSPLVYYFSKASGPFLFFIF